MASQQHGKFATFAVTYLRTSDGELSPLVGAEQFARVDVDHLGLRVDADMAAGPGKGIVHLGDDPGGRQFGHPPTYRWNRKLPYDVRIFGQYGSQQLSQDTTWKNNEKLSLLQHLRFSTYTATLFQQYKVTKWVAGEVFQTVFPSACCSSVEV